VWPLESCIVLRDGSAEDASVLECEFLPRSRPIRRATRFTSEQRQLALARPRERAAIEHFRLPAESLTENTPRPAVHSRSIPES
jgi:hypothetical protein